MRFNIFPIVKPVSAPVLKWWGGQTPPKDAADEYEIAKIVSEASVRSTLQGGTIPYHAREVAAELGKQLDPARVFP